MLLSRSTEYNILGQKLPERGRSNVLIYFSFKLNIIKRKTNRRNNVKVIYSHFIKTIQAGLYNSNNVYFNCSL